VTLVHVFIGFHLCRRAGCHVSERYRHGVIATSESSLRRTYLCARNVNDFIKNAVKDQTLGQMEQCSPTDGAALRLAMTGPACTIILLRPGEFVKSAGTVVWR
jgi:hypothetical protein